MTTSMACNHIQLPSFYCTQILWWSFLKPKLIIHNLLLLNIAHSDGHMHIYVENAHLFCWQMHMYGGKCMCINVKCTCPHVSS